MNFGFSHESSETHGTSPGSPDVRLRGVWGFTGPCACNAECSYAVIF